MHRFVFAAVGVVCHANVQPGVMGRREFVFPHEVAGNGPPNDAGNDEPEHAARSANLQCVVDTGVPSFSVQ